MLLVLKLPMVYVCWVVWWAIRAVPEAGTGGGGSERLDWKPWQRPTGPRPRRGGPHGRRVGAMSRTGRPRMRS
jgi:hypothetical protein